MRRELWEPAAFFALVMILVFWKLLFHPDYTLIYGGDMCAQTYPWFQMAAHWLKRGVFPLWDPFAYAGRPTLGELQQGVLYPLNWLAQLIPDPEGGIRIRAIEAEIVLHFYAFALGCYLLARSLGLGRPAAALSGIVLAVGGYTSQLFSWMNIFSAFTWVPLTIYCFRKSMTARNTRQAVGRLAAASGFTALSLLAGHHAPAVHATVFLVAYLTLSTISDWGELDARARRWRFTLVPVFVGCTGLLAAVQLLPSAEWARHVVRWVGQGDPVRWGDKIPYSALGTTGNLHPQDLMSLVVPYLSTGANLYVGALVVLLALVGMLHGRGREPRILTGLFFLYAFLSLGSLSAAHGWLNSFFPGVWFAREVYLYLVPLQLCIALLCGFGLDRLVAGYSSAADGEVRVIARRLGWGAAALVCAGGILLLAARYVGQLQWEHPYARATSMIALYLAAFGILLFFVHTGRLGARLFGLTLVGLVLLDLASQFSDRIAYTGAGSPDRQAAAANRFLKPRAAKYLRELQSDDVFRVDDPDGMFPPNFGDAWLIEATMGHGATARADYLEFRDAGWEPGSNVSALLNAQYVMSAVPIPWMEQPLAEEPLFRNPRALPRAFAVSRYRAFSSDREMLAWLPTPLLSPGRCVLLREEELLRLPQGWMQQLTNDDEGLGVRALSWWTAAERRAGNIPDPKDKRRVHFYRAPWGWSAGDELTLAVKPPTSTAAFLVVEYRPAAETSRLDVQIEGGGRKETRTLTIPGFEEPPSASLQQAVLDLGTLAPEEYRISFVRTDDCKARLESVRVTRTSPAREPEKSGSVAVMRRSPNRLKLDAVMPQPGFVVISEPDYPGWEARLDGRPAPLIRVDYMLKAVPVPAGRHELDVRFRATSFRWGLAISTLAAIGLTAAVCVRFPRGHA